MERKRATLKMNRLVYEIDGLLNDQMARIIVDTKSKRKDRSSEEGESNTGGYGEYW